MNKQELESVMKRNGDTQESLANALCISRVALNRKINESNGAAFTQPEIQAIISRYNLSAEETENIFFANDVSN